MNVGRVLLMALCLAAVCVPSHSAVVYKLTFDHGATTPAPVTYYAASDEVVPTNVRGVRMYYGSYPDNNWYSGNLIDPDVPGPQGGQALNTSFSASWPNKQGYYFGRDYVTYTQPGFPSNVNYGTATYHFFSSSQINCLNPSGSAGPVISNDYTIEAIVRPDFRLNPGMTALDQMSTIFSSIRQDSVAGGARLWVNQISGQIGFSWGNDASITPITSDVVLGPNTWYHVTAVSRSGANGAMELYVNGVQVGRADYPIGLATQGKVTLPGYFTVGADYWAAGSHNWQGQIDAICVSNTSLAPASFTLHQYAGQTPPPVTPDRIVVTDYPNISDAVDAARQLGVYDIYIPSGNYYYYKTLNLTTGPGEAGKPFNLHGAGASTVLYSNTGDNPAIDLTGSSRVVLSDFILSSPIANQDYLKGGSVGILMARVAPVSGDAASSGSHTIRNVTIQGHYSVADVFSYCSENNSYSQGEFINTGGDAVIITGVNKEGVTSPYQQLGFGSNSQTTFYYLGLWVGKANSVGLRITEAENVTLFGCFVATYINAFSAIYLDGTGTCENISIQDLRTEGISGHTIYAAGGVENVVLEGGSLQASNAEVIHHVDSVPSNDGPHRFVARPTGSGRARNWLISGSWVGRSITIDPSVTYDFMRPVTEGLTSIRFESLQDSKFSNLSFYARRQIPGQEDWNGIIVTDTPMVVVEDYSRRNTFEVPSRESVDLRGDSRGNSIIALADDLSEKVPALWMAGYSDYHSIHKYYDGGTRRFYVDPDGSGSLLNFGVGNLSATLHSRKGDVAIHDGTGFADGIFRLAAYDGTTWRFLVPDTQDPRKSIGEAKALADGTLVNCTGVVTATFSGYLYIEDPSLSSGIRLTKDSYLAATGDTVTVDGVVGTLATGERHIVATGVTALLGAGPAAVGETQ